MEARDLSITKLTVLYHVDLRRIGERAVLKNFAPRRPVRLSRTEPEFSAVGGGFPRPLDDDYLSRRPLVLRSVDGGIEIDCEETSTSLEVDGSPVTARIRLTADRIARPGFGYVLT